MKPRDVTVVAVLLIALALALAAASYAAAKSYQFTGVVKAVDATSLTVEKSAKEAWQFELAKDTKGGPPKVGDRVTVYYKMVTTEIEAKPAATQNKRSRRGGQSSRPLSFRRARRSRLSGARGGVTAARYSRSRRRASISSAVGGGVRSSYSNRASALDTCRSASARTRTCCLRPNGRPISISSPSFSRRFGFTGCPLTETFPVLHAACASERVLNRQATSSQASIRTLSAARSCSSAIFVT
jgi:hypothetical protein